MLLDLSLGGGQSLYSEHNDLFQYSEVSEAYYLQITSYCIVSSKSINFYQEQAEEYLMSEVTDGKHINKDGEYKLGKVGIVQHPSSDGE